MNIYKNKSENMYDINRVYFSLKRALDCIVFGLAFYHISLGCALLPFLEEFMQVKVISSS